MKFKDPKTGEISGMSMESFKSLKNQVHDKSPDLQEMIRRIALYEKELDQKMVEKVVHMSTDRAMFTKDAVTAARVASHINGDNETERA